MFLLFISLHIVIKMCCLSIIGQLFGFLGFLLCFLFLFNFFVELLQTVLFLILLLTLLFSNVLIIGKSLVTFSQPSYSFLFPSFLFHLCDPALPLLSLLLASYFTLVIFISRYILI